METDRFSVGRDWRIDRRPKFGLPSAEPTKDTRIVVVEVTHLILGFIVDSVEEVLRLPEEFIEQ
ncbi:MAG: hypothetical protein E4H32_10005, partial [Nitrospirales bacterium]